MDFIFQHITKKAIDWGFEKFKPTPKESAPEPSILDQVQRFKRVMSAHGMRPEHWSRFFSACDAPFSIARTDQLNNESLLKWVDDNKVDWLCETFLIRRDWMDGESNPRPHEGFYFNKNPQRFYETITKELEREPNGRSDLKAQAFFICDSNKKDAEHSSGVRILVAVAIPLCRLSNEVTVYRYIFDDVGGGYPWHDIPYHNHLRILARLCFQHFHFEMWGLGFPKEEFEKIAEGESMIPEILQKPGRHYAAWHPEDYGLASCESEVAKEAETLDLILEWMESAGLPTSQKKAIF